MGPPPGFKCACVHNSEMDVLEVEIKPRQKNKVEFVLKKKTGREAKELPDR